MTVGRAALISLFATTFSTGVATTAQADSTLSIQGQTRFHAPVKGDSVYYDASVQPALRADIGDSWALVAIARIFVDGDDRLEPGRPSQDFRSAFNRRLLIGDQAEIDLREAYLAGYAGPAYLTIGKQQIVWGKADRIRVLDIVNPLSFREFILPEFEDSRIPLWGARAEIPIGAFQAEAVFVPDRTYAEFAGPGGVFAFTAPQFLPPQPNSPGPVLMAPAANRDEGFDYGARLSGLVGGWDVAILYFRHTEDAPLFNTDDQAGETIITPVFNRAHLVGGSLSNAFGDLTLRAEVGYMFDRGLSASNTFQPAEIDHADSIAYVIGADWYGLENTLITVQFFQDKILNADPLTRKSTDSFLTGAVRRSMKNETITLQLRTLTNLADNDVMLQVSGEYEMRESLSALISADLFFGDPDGTFGQFEEASRISLGLRYAF